MSDSKKEKNNRNQKKYREKMLAAGVCPACGTEQLEKGSTKCEKCKDKARKLNQKRKEDREKAGICTRCGKAKSAAGVKMCKECMEYNKRRCKERQDKLKKSGVCTKCAKPVTKGVLCDQCKEDSRVWARIRGEDRLNKGLCEKCGKNPHEPGVTRCVTCKEKDDDSAYKKKYGITRQEVKKMLVDQGNKCAVCDCQFHNNYVVDHCHNTEEVRGLLCQKCNLFLGRYEAEKERLHKFEKYINNPPYQQ